LGFAIGASEHFVRFWASRGFSRWSQATLCADQREDNAKQ